MIFGESRMDWALSIRASGHPGIQSSGHPGIQASGHPGIRASGLWASGVVVGSMILGVRSSVKRREINPGRGVRVEESWKLSSFVVFFCGGSQGRVGVQACGCGCGPLRWEPHIVAPLKTWGAYHRGVVQSSLVRLARWRSVVCEAETMAMSSQRREGE